MARTWRLGGSSQGVGMSANMEVLVRDSTTLNRRRCQFSLRGLFLFTNRGTAIQGNREHGPDPTGRASPTVSD